MRMKPAELKGTVVSRAGAGGRRSALGALSAGQRELIDLCEAAVQPLGFSRSMGRIFGLIYSSPEPVPFRELVEKLELSKGSISQSLRQLCELEAVRVIRDRDGRRCSYAPEPELRRMIAKMVEARLLAPVEQGARRLREFKERLYRSGEPEQRFLVQRLSILQALHRKALRVLPLVRRSIEGAGA